MNSYTYLGTKFSSSGKFNLAVKENYKKTVIVINNIKDILYIGEKVKLLNSVINATAPLYGSEIWGPIQGSCLEKCQLQSVKSIFRLHRSTPNIYVELEPGINNLLVETWKRTINWWAKILQMPSTRTTKQCYIRLMELDADVQNREEYN